MKTLVVLGSTGSIGTQTLDVCRAHPDRFEVRGLAAGRSWEAVLEQAREFRPRFVAMADPRNDCERYNEQISLLCNMEGARLLRESEAAHLQPIFRTHEAPADERMRDLDEVTQLTAANSEQLASSADETASQVQRLGEIVDMFHVRDAFEGIQEGRRSLVPTLAEIDAALPSTRASHSAFADFGAARRIDI